MTATASQKRTRARLERLHGPFCRTAQTMSSVEWPSMSSAPSMWRTPRPIRMKPWRPRPTATSCKRR